MNPPAKGGGAGGLKLESEFFSIKKQNIFISGFMAAGKSTVGPLVAQELNRLKSIEDQPGLRGSPSLDNWTFVDLDTRVADSQKNSVQKILNQKGEIFYRNLESECLLELCRRTKQVVALGGGSILKEENRSQMRRVGALIYLRYSSEVLLQRLLNDPDELSSRPLLRLSEGQTLLTRIEDLLKERRYFYEDADLIFDFSDDSPVKISHAIIQRLFSHRARRGSGV